MLTAIEGIYRNGRVELREQPPNLPEESRVIVTFLGPTAGIDLRVRGIDSDQAAELRGRLAAFTEDWESPEMDAYDDYDAARANR
jgi:hypothetical protein